MQSDNCICQEFKENENVFSTRMVQQAGTIKCAGIWTLDKEDFYIGIKLKDGEELGTFYITHCPWCGRKLAWDNKKTYSSEDMNEDTTRQFEEFWKSCDFKSWMEEDIDD